jgi:hypothetical protein
MNLKNKLRTVVIGLMTLGAVCTRTNGALPPDFPGIVVSNLNRAAVSPGCVFLAVAADLRPTVGVYLMIVTNDGSVVWREKLEVPEIYDFKVAANGRLSCAPFIEEHSWVSGGDVFHQIRDENYQIVETLTGGNGYVAEAHDFQLLPNGNALQIGYYLSEVDVSKFLAGGHPAARVAGGIVQELDADRNVIFQWRSWDHYGFETNITSTNALIDGFHLNTLDQDTDGHILFATPQWVKKINRQTGEIMWHLGGDENQFTFAGGGAASDFGGHSFSRLSNGNVLIYDNGGRGSNDAPSKVHEYQLDEVHKVATRVWTYTSSPPIHGWHLGNAQRLPNGNTLIGWGGAQGYSPTCTEVTPAGEKVFELWFTNSSVQSYRAFRFNWPPTDKLEFTQHEVATGNEYPFTGTGVSLEVLDGGGGYNSLIVTRQPYAPVNPVFLETAPRVLPLRVQLSQSAITKMTAQISFDTASFGFKDPDQLKVYYRSLSGRGIFTEQPTVHNPVTHQLRALVTLTPSEEDFGEFIFVTPELPDLLFAPLLAEVENYRGVQTHEVTAPKRGVPGMNYAVNQERDILLSWSPQGLARGFALQIATSSDFNNLAVDEAYLTEARYIWNGAAPDTSYSYRVKTFNNAGESDWSVGSFHTVADLVPVTVATDPTGLTVMVDGTNYTAPARFDWLPGSSHRLEAASPQLAGDGHSRWIFSSWSDGGTQTNSISAPLSATTYTARFATQYLLATSLNPVGAGTVTNLPLGPWYDAGQLVLLTANTNTGYRFSYWQGADSASNNLAQVTMNGYYQVQACYLPVDYPYVIITNTGAVAPGVLIGSIGGRTADGTKTYYVVLDATGTNPVFSSKTVTLSRFALPQGLDAVAGGGNFSLKDETFNVVDTFKTLGYTLDTHDIDLLPNGHALVFAQEFQTVDMSQIVPGGKPNANVTGNVIQEIDANKRLVFEWHTFDHIPITNTFADMTQANFDYAHINSVSIDPTDNQLLASLRTTSEIVKINRQTGEVMWRLGGKNNQFTFIGEHEENAPYYTVGQHDIHRLANGNLLYFDNGNISGGGITSSDRNYSRVVEYQLDEISKTATLVWEFRHPQNISAPCRGSVKRFANGNTLVNWGCAVASSGIIVTEVSPAGQIVFEMKHQVKGPSADLTKQVWNSPDLIRSSRYQDVKAGQMYASLAAGVSVSVNSVSGPVENELVVERHLDAVRFPQFSGKAPQVVMEHVTLAGSGLDAMAAKLELNLPDTRFVFDTPLIHDPAQLVVYQRVIPGQGEFAALPTTYDSEQQRLQVTITRLGEFIFAYPDLAETPYVPWITSPADQSEVNQAAPVTLTWKPRGLVNSSDLQVATDADFAHLVLDTNGLGSSSFVLEKPLPKTLYFWRVRIVNQGGTSAWVSGSFTTVPPLLELIYPGGGELWQRFQVVTIRWNDNLAENVALEIYKGGISNRTFAANIASSGSYTWTVGQYQAFPPGADYTIKIRSTTNPGLFDFSESFSIVEPPVINRASFANLPDGRVQFELTAAGMTQASVCRSTNLVDWELLDTVPLSDGRGVFTDNSATNWPCRFYRARLP